MEIKIEQATVGNTIILELRVFNANGQALAFEMLGSPAWSLVNAANVAPVTTPYMGQCQVTALDATKPASATVTCTANLKAIRSVEFPDIPDMPYTQITGSVPVQFLLPYVPATLKLARV